MLERTDAVTNVGCGPGTDHPKIHIIHCMLERTDAITNVGCGLGTDYPYIHIFQCMLERTDAITNEVLEPITFVVAYPTVYWLTTKCNLYSLFIHDTVIDRR